LSAKYSPPSSPFSPRAGGLYGIPLDRESLRAQWDVVRAFVFGARLDMHLGTLAKLAEGRSAYFWEAMEYGFSGTVIRTVFFSFCASPKPVPS
jgi:hypothetical protein